MQNKDARIFLVFSLGATFSNRDGRIDIGAMSSIAKQFKELLWDFRSKIVIVAVVGAGGLGRQYVNFARENVSKAADFDAIGIEASHVNALLFSSALRKSGVLTNASIPQSAASLAHYLSDDRFECVVLGGLEEGMTSDSTAATIALENGNSMLVIVSTVGGIFSLSSKDMRQHTEILQSVDRVYLKKIIRSRPKEHVLDVQTCEILLSRKAKGMYAIATGYQNILQVTKAAISSGRKKSKMIIPGTRILL